MRKCLIKIILIIIVINIFYALTKYSSKNHILYINEYNRYKIVKEIRRLKLDTDGIKKLELYQGWFNSKYKVRVYYSSGETSSLVMGDGCYELVSYILNNGCKADTKATIIAVISTITGIVLIGLIEKREKNTDV